MGRLQKATDGFNPSGLPFQPTLWVCGVWRTGPSSSLETSALRRLSANACWFWRGQRAVKHQKCVMSKREESGPPWPLLIQTPRGHHGQIHHELSVLSGVLAGQSEPSWRVRANNSLIAAPKPACEDHVWENTAVLALSDAFPPKICCCQRWCHKTSPDVLRC